MDNQKTIGEQLIEARVAQKLLISQVSRALSIRPSIIDALEKNEFVKIGATVYARGYLQRYAAFLNLDHVRLDALMKQQCSQTIAPIELSPHKKPPPSYLAYYSTFVLCVMSAVVFYFWNYQNDMNDMNTISIPVTHAQQITNNDDLTQATVTVFKQEANVQSIGEQQDIIDMSAQLSEPLPLPNTDTTRYFSNPTPSPALSFDSPLQITVDDDNWTEIRDTTGKVVISEILKPGKVYEINGTAPFKLKFGNAQSISSIIYNGEAVSMDVIKPTRRTYVHRMTLGE